MIENVKKLIIKYREILLYLIFGGLTTLLNWSTYGVLEKFAGLGMNTSNVIAWVAGVLFAYFTNRKWVFESKVTDPAGFAKEFALFVGARAFSGAVEIIGLPLLVSAGLNQSLFGVDGFIAKMVISVVVVILNYIFSKVIIFRKKSKGN
jgi:putative flippase GtrA